MKLYNETYKFNLYVYYCSFESINKKRKKHGVIALNQKEEYTGGMYTTDDHLYHMIWINSRFDLPYTIGALTHEISHAVFNILELKGLKLSDSSEETYCYLVQWIVEKVIESGIIIKVE